MRLNTRMDSHLMPEIFRLFFSITGEKPWLARRRELEHRKRTEPGVATILNTIYSRELAISGLILNRYKDFGYPSAYDKPELLGSYSFVTTFVRLYQNLPGAGCRRLAAILLGDLQNRGLGSLALELETAAHLSHLGFNLDFHDLMGGSTGSFDFLASRDGIEIEIDCKAISADTGNPITAFGAAAITSFSDDAIKNHREAGRTIVLEVTTAKKVSKRDDVAKGIARSIAESLENKESVVSEWFTVNYVSYPSNEISSFEKQPTVQYPLLDDKFGEWDHIIAKPDEGHGGVILLLKSTIQSNRVSKISKTLKDSLKKQFSHSRPIVLFVRLADMTGDIFIRYVGQRTFMYDVCESLFLSKNEGSHIAGVVFVPGVPIFAKKTGDGSRVAGEQSVSLFIRNKNHPLHDSPILSMLHPPVNGEWQAHIDI